MPELAEVEFMSRQLHRWLAGAPLSLEILDPKLDPSGALAAWAGGHLRRAYRRGKYSLLVGDEAALVLHFRMTGKVTRVQGEMPKYARALLRSPKAEVAFCDARRFGTLELVPLDELHAWERSKKIGEEPWPELRSGEWWWERLGALRKPVKAALLAQDRVCGLGNILASEVLFQARVAPTRRACDVGVEEWDAISQALHQTVNGILEREQGEEIRYVNQGGSPQAAGFLVYGQQGEPAPCCGAPIARSVEAGRSTYWCPHCQR